jgi:hypothetical protein
MYPRLYDTTQPYRSQAGFFCEHLPQLRGHFGNKNMIEKKKSIASIHLIFGSSRTRD